MGEAKRRKKLDPNYYGKSTPNSNNYAIPAEGENIAEPDYLPLVNAYLKYGSSHLNLKIREWLEDNDPSYIAYQNIEGKLVPNLDRVNKIAETVYTLASKQSKIMSSKDPKRGRFNLSVPSEPDDYGTYAPVRDNPELALEGMRLFNTGFFDKAITELINSDGDVVSTLRKHVVLIYMGTNENYQIIDAACSLVRLKPFQVVKYVGEQRHSLDTSFEKVFKPLAAKIEDFRITQKGADKFPCLTLLFFIENKTNLKFCEFRKHYTAQGGSQLTIPGFSSERQGLYVGPPLNILGNPLNIPTIRGFNPNEEDVNDVIGDVDSETESESESESENAPYSSKEPQVDNTNKVCLIKHEAMTKRLTKPVYVYGSLVESIHMLVCTHPMLFNRGFCHIKTREHEITLWLDAPFQKPKMTQNSFLEFSREWYGTFTTEIVNGKVNSVSRKFSMKSLPNLGPAVQIQAMLSGEAVDKFTIEGLISTETSVDLPPEEITIQAPM